MPNLETNGGDLDQQQSLIIKVKLSDDAYGSSDERALLADIEEAIQSRLADGGAGVLDGDEFGGGCCTIFLYGPDAEALASVVSEVLDRFTFPAGSELVKRYGPPGSTEVRIALDRKLGPLTRHRSAEAQAAVATSKRRASRILLEPGDCFSIPLRDGKFAFGQYLGPQNWHGPLIRVFDVISSEIVSVDVLAKAGLLFPPISVGLNPPVRIKRWRKIGSFPVEGFECPKFRFSLEHRRGINHDWHIWNGKNWEKVGDLPPEYRSLENSGIWAYVDVEERILTGRNPFHEGVE